MNHPIKLAIFDDHPMVGSGLQASLSAQKDIQVAYLAKSKTELFGFVDKEPVHLLIADVIAPDISGLELFKELRAQWPKLKVIAYSSLNNTLLIRSLLALDVKAFVNKREPLEALLETIKLVMNGETRVPPQFEMLIGPKHSNEAVIEVSSREHQLLQLIARGLLSKEIASEMGISINTVGNHRSNLFQKFGVQNLAELIRRAQQLGFIHDD